MYAKYKAPFKDIYMLSAIWGLYSSQCQGYSLLGYNVL